MKQAVRDAGLTLDELARLIGCSRALIYQYASGASLAQSDRLQQIAQAVDKPLQWFFQDQGAETEQAAVVSPAATQHQELQAERDRLAAERSRLEQRRMAEDVAHIEALLAAYSSPPDPRKVVDCCNQLYPLLARDEDPTRLAGVLLQQGNALIQLQEWGAAREKLEEAGALYRGAGQSVAARDCLQSLGHVNLMLGRVEEALQQFSHVAAGEDWANRWQGTLSVGACHEMLGSYEEAISAFESALEIVEERGAAHGAEVARLYIEANWSNLELNFGDFRSALARSQRCIRAALRLGNQDQYMEALLTCGVAQLSLGEERQAAHSFQLAMDVADLTADQQHRSLALSYLSLCDSAAYRSAAAISGGKEALALALRCSAVRAEIAAQRALSEAYLASANAAEALYHAQQGLIVATNMRVRLSQAQFGALKARARLVEGDFAEADTEAEKALALAIELHARPAQAECHLARAQAAQGIGDSDAAALHANAAIQLATELHARDIAWRGQALLARAATGQGQQAEARTAFERAIAGVQAARTKQQESSDEDSLLEDPFALNLWYNWLRFVAAADGAERARAVAMEAEWPPLVDWIEQHLQSEGEGTNE